MYYLFTYLIQIIFFFINLSTFDVIVLSVVGYYSSDKKSIQLQGYYYLSGTQLVYLHANDLIINCIFYTNHFPACLNINILKNQNPRLQLTNIFFMSETIVRILIES